MIVALADAIADEAHEGQTDLSGQPYIEHPRRVAGRVACLGPEYEAAALLHDVIEDTAVTAADLLDRGVSAEVVEAVIALTHLPNERRHDYYDRILKSEVALAVKLADVLDNADPDRMHPFDDRTKERLKKKYADALMYLATRGALSR